MTKYVLTSVHYTGAIALYYDNAGLLVFYSVLDAVLTDDLLVKFLRKLPREEGDLAPLNVNGYFTIKKVSEDLSFNNFWELFDKKIHPGRCEPIWNKLSDVKKLQALKAIDAYDAYLERKGVAKCNPEKYLRWEYWKTDWSKEV